MKKLLAALMSLVLVFGLMPCSFVAFGETEGGGSQTPDARLNNLGSAGVDYVEGQVIACVKGGQAALDKELGANDALLGADSSPLMQFTAHQEAIDLAVAAGEGDKEAFAEAQQRMNLYQGAAVGEDSYEIILVPTGGQSVPSFIEKLESLDCVAFAEPNYLCELTYTLDDAKNEPYYPYEWYLDKNGIPVNWDMNAESAYSSAAFSSSDEVVVAVMDSGVDYTHPDLKDSMWNEGLNYPTLVSMGGGEFGINTSGEPNTDDPMDTVVGHGTHCASTIASTWANNEGIAGVNGNAKIMACRWMADSGGAIANAVKGYAYVIEAKKQGVPLVAVNNSWGGTSSTLMSSPLMVTMINLAGEEGIISCFAAGNSSYSHDHYTNLVFKSPYMITVGAMNSTGARAWFSDYGKVAVDVFAPGTQILAATSLQETVEQMPAMYLPWIESDVGKANQGTFAFEDFEDENDTVQVSGLDGTPFQERAGGYASSFSRQLDVSGLAVGDEVGFEIHIPLKSAQYPDGIEVPASDSYYFAFEAGVSNMSFGTDASEKSPIMKMQYQDANGTWVDPTVAARWREIDGNWSLSSGALSDLNAMVEAAKARGDNVVKLRLKGVVESLSDASALYIDNIGFGTKTSKYYYSDGTSMATPCATGVVSLVAGSRGSLPENGEDVLDIIARVKGSVARTGLLDDACVTKGCVQATALLATDTDFYPVLDDATRNGEGTAIIEGRFFGSASGSVTIGGIEANVLSWSDTAISVEIPAGTPYGLQEYRVIRPDGKDGRNFGIFAEADGYVDLPVSSVVYADEAGRDIPTAGLVPLRIAATDDGVLAELADTDGIIAAMQFFSFDTQTWADIPYPETFDAGSAPMECLSSLVAGKNEVYLLATTKPDSSGFGQTHLLTFDTSTLEWVFDVTLSDSFNGSEFLALDKEGRLLVTLGTNSTDSGVYQIFPDTGMCGQALSSLPSEKTAGSCGTLLVSGDTQIVAGVNMGIIGRVLEAQLGIQGVPCDPPCVLNSDGTWTDGATPFFDNLGNSYADPEKTEPALDAGQSLLAAYGALDGGFIMAGPARDIDAPNMVDTWVYHAATDTYTALDARCDVRRLRGQAGTSHNGTFYVLGASAVDDKLVFRSLNLESRGLSCTDAAYNAQRSEKDLLITAIGEVWLNGENGGYYVVDAEGKLTHEGADSANYQVFYDPASNKVTLNNLRFEGMQESHSAVKRAAVFSKNNLTIELVGTNEIVGSPATSSFVPPKNASGIRSEGTITFTGDGDLLVKSGDSSIRNSGVSAKGDIVFSGTGSLDFAGQMISTKSYPSLAGIALTTVGIDTGGKVDVRSGSVSATAEKIALDYGKVFLPASISSLGVSAQSLSVGGEALVSVVAGDVKTQGDGKSIGIETDEVPAFGVSTVIVQHGTVVQSKPQGESNPDALTDDELEAAIKGLLFGGKLSQADRAALLAGERDTLKALLSQNPDATAELVETSYTLAPAAVEGFDAAAWYGASEDEALSAGEKTLDELAANLGKLYTKVAVAAKPGPTPDPKPVPGPDPNPDPWSHSNTPATGDAIAFLPLVLMLLASAAALAVAASKLRRRN